MASLDVIAPNYRRAQQRWPDASTLARCFNSLEACFDGDSHGLVEHVKSFVESVCLTIMGEFREPVPSTQPTTTELLIAALAPLGLKNTRGAAKLDKVLSGFNRLSDAISDMRNENGPVAHGKDGFVDSIAADHARIFLHAGDAILGVLLNAFEGKQPDLIVTREPYENFPHLNSRIDHAVAVQVRIDDEEDRPVIVFSVNAGPRGEVIELRAEPSRLLYGIDREAYVDVLNTVGAAASELEMEEEKSLGTEIGGPIGAPDVVVASTEGPVIKLIAEYRGILTALQRGADAFLKAEGVDPNGVGPAGARVLNSLLATAELNMALDWKERETVQAKIKVSCKRVLIQFGCPRDKADTVAEHFVRWLQVRAPDSPAPMPVVSLPKE